MDIEKGFYIRIWVEGLRKTINTTVKKASASSLADI
jgi:hypothetical protein